MISLAFILFYSHIPNIYVNAQTCSQHLNINKVVSNDINGIATGVQFHIIARIDGIDNDASLQSGGTTAICVNPGQSFHVVELGSNPSIEFDSTPSSGCDGVMGNSDVTCTITNTIGLNSGQDAISAPLTPGVPNNLVKTQPIHPQAAIGQGSTSSQASPTDRLTNPPFQVCQANVLPTATGTNAILRLPSSGTYIIQGTVDATKVRSALNSLQSQDQSITIQLLSDLRPQDGTMTSIANPQFMGKFIITNNAGTTQRIIDFNVIGVRTECKYITLVKAVGHATNKNVAPLGDLANAKTSDLKAPDIDQLLVGGSTVTSTLANTGVASSLNPPFATCVTAGTTNQFTNQVNPIGIVGDNLALYNLRGDVKSMQNLGNSFILEITSDIIPSDDDLAKIVKNNNPYVKVNLLSQEGQNSVNIVPFELQDLWTDCKAVSLTTKSIFEPLPGEINP